MQVNLFGLKAIVKVTNTLADLVLQANGLQRRSGDFLYFVIPVHLYSKLR
jgi:hypothetical protein